MPVYTCTICKYEEKVIIQRIQTSITHCDRCSTFIHVSCLKDYLSHDNNNTNTCFVCKRGSFIIKHVQGGTCLNINILMQRTWKNIKSKFTFCLDVYRLILVVLFHIIFMMSILMILALLMKLLRLLFGINPKFNNVSSYFLDALLFFCLVSCLCVITIPNASNRIFRYRM
ncbi:hypothetical protein [Heterosigma akashiwo virus 01]|uniref:Uncharacterized protein n=1 Tax=Heterosigma akashiwo virus 01 TaxID=97195 RepID=A0A1C9C518_HAV01|nr:hypothetical protein D1R72_gp050 [Heterosigma akashiwo virus 01]AOM63381.1 hypothetical protein [Heterosigma akashiwo virus 01]